ncbi:uncharacterized protein JN550_000999 [Neoarthrinium moseri]|uniref:uncharacterized protein n=1 Tax=Neoarthrinium moseri TaxID=1658444 RepID=UPI001FDB7504|nr:uncharacterized protein JN550_000999 [Neoarthrinium moseri]KAI1876927.1 hypothetical protein JN550_000999 [Neoarthrinium moseri]
MLPVAGTDNTTASLEPNNGPKSDADESVIPTEYQTSSIKSMLKPRSKTSYEYKFSFMPGFFVDYVKAAELYPDAKVQTLPNLGITGRGYGAAPEGPSSGEQRPSWRGFTEYLQGLNERNEHGESYKLLFLIRHAAGVHNIFMEQVGTDAWNDYWAHLEGDGKVIWLDARAVDSGIVEAQRLAQFWIDGVQNDDMPLPGTLYTSPLARCLETTRLVYAPVFKSQQRSLQPVVKELLRERLTGHTCDKRSTRSWIAKAFPECQIEPGFAESDSLWRADYLETPEDHVARKRELLEEIFSNDDSPFISLTTHSYAISAILKVVGAPKFRVAEAAMVPLFIKAEKIAAGAP